MISVQHLENPGDDLPAPLSFASESATYTAVQFTTSMGLKMRRMRTTS